MEEQPKKIQSKPLIAAAVLILVIVTASYFWRSQNLTAKNTSSSQPAPSVQGASVSANRERHVVIVVEENTRYSSVIGNTRDMPYLNGLVNTYAYARNYFADTHPSIGNYFMLTAGNIITNNDSSSATVSDDNIVRHLVASGKTWKEYSENLPSVGYTGGDQDPYEEHHNPLSYFSDVRNNPDQAKNLVPFSQFADDLKNNRLPDYAFVVPNNFNNAHDCPSGGILCTQQSKLSTVDGWLKNNIDPLLKNPEFNSPGGGVLIITFDESAKSDLAHGGGQAAWVVAGPDVKKGYASDTFYQHENTLRFISELLGLTSFPGKSSSAASMGDFLNNN